MMVAVESRSPTLFSEKSRILPGSIEQRTGDTLSLAATIPPRPAIAL